MADMHSTFGNRGLKILEEDLPFGETSATPSGAPYRYDSFLGNPMNMPHLNPSNETTGSEPQGIRDWGYRRLEQPNQK